jgi:hypothetical protein
MPLDPIRAPIATSAVRPGMSSEMKASDSPNASAKTMGSAQALFSRTKAIIGRMKASTEILQKNP